jgi:hypothetical protein
LAAILWLVLGTGAVCAQGQTPSQPAPSSQAVPSAPSSPTASTDTPVPTAAPSSSPAPVAKTEPAVPSPSPAASNPVTTPRELHLAGKFGIGTDTIRIDENSTSAGSSPGTALITAVDAIWWLSDDSGIDFLATLSEGQNPGVDFKGNEYNYPNEILGAGLGYRQVVASPVRELKIQGLARATYGHYSNQLELWYYSPANLSFESGNERSENFVFMAGLGFEYFMPFCESLSVQSYLCYVASYTDNSASTTYNSTMANYGYSLSGFNNTSYQSSYWRTSLLLSGLSLSTLSVHFYF